MTARTWLDWFSDLDKARESRDRMAQMLRAFAYTPQRTVGIEPSNGGYAVYLYTAS